MNREIMRILLILSMLTSSSFAFENKLDNSSKPSDKAEVIFVSASQQFDGKWCFKTSVKHNDEGWDHYANGWEILDAKGNLLWERPLTHPHVNEQPFTRRLCDVQISPETTELIVRAKCNKHSYGNKTISVDFTKTKGTGYEVKRFE